MTLDVTTRVGRKRKQDTLLAHCIARALIDDAGGLDAAKEKYGEEAEALVAQSKWRQVKLLLKVTPKASRVALAMKDLRHSLVTGDWRFVGAFDDARVRNLGEITISDSALFFDRRQLRHFFLKLL